MAAQVPVQLREMSGRYAVEAEFHRRGRPADARLGPGRRSRALPPALPGDRWLSLQGARLFPRTITGERPCPLISFRIASVMHSAPIRDVEAHRETPLAIIALLTAFAPIVLLYRVLAYLYASAAAWWARHRWRQSCRTLGNRMNDAEIGDQFLRDRVTDARRMLEGNARHDRARILSAELRDAFESLGKSGGQWPVSPSWGPSASTRQRGKHTGARHRGRPRAAAAAKTLPQSWRGCAPAPRRLCDDQWLDLPACSAQQF